MAMKMKAEVKAEVAPKVAVKAVKAVKAEAEVVKKVAAPKVSKRLVGVTTKVGVQKTWHYIFEKNESRRPKMTDEQITEFMQKEFPTKTSEVFGMVSRCRKEYNEGYFGEIKVDSTKRPSAEDIANEKTTAKKAIAKPNTAKKAKKTSALFLEEEDDDNIQIES